MWETAGGRVSESVGHTSAVAILGDDPAATGAVALGVARAHAATRRVFLFDLLGDGHALTSDNERGDYHGVSDMVNYGVSLGRVARPMTGIPNLFIVAGGAESPLSDDILSHRQWSTIIGQVKRANALLVVAAPSLAPSLPALLGRLDGLLLVGEAVSPMPHAPILAEVRAAAAMRTPAVSVRTVASATGTAGRRHAWRLPAFVFALAVLGAALGFSRWRSYVGLGDSVAATRSSTVDGLPPIPSQPIVTIPVGNEASYSVELLFTNSNQDALEFLTQSSDSLPGATFSTQSLGVETDLWYRLLVGAFPDSLAADRYLQQLRVDGRVATGAGAVARTPFALILDSASSDALAGLRVAAYRGRGIPAYVLRDSVGKWRVYAGAFAMEDDAQLLKRHLDSLNIQSALSLRAGSTS